MSAHCTGLLFAEFPNALPGSLSELISCSSGLDGRSDSAAQVPGGYSELGDGQVMEVLSKHLERFQKGSAKEGEEEDEKKRGESSSSSDRPSLPNGHASCSGVVLYREAIEHCARLYRIMVSKVCLTW